MFRESLLETSAATITQRSWATLMSFGLEMAGIGVLLVTPMIVTQTLPLINNEQFITAPLAAPHGHVNVREEAPVAGSGNNSGAITEPIRIPTRVATGPDPVAHGGPDVAPPCTFCVEGGTGDPASRGSVLTDIVGRTLAVALPAVPTAPTQKIQISRMDEGLLVSRVEPPYPPLARAARVQGEVVLAAVIGKNGRIENLRVISGHPMLARAALDAVSQWRYRPYMLNGQPVEVDTTIAVKFTLRQD